MKHRIILILILFCGSTISAQNYCDGNESESFYPLRLGVSKKIFWNKNTYNENIIALSTFKNKEYFKVSQYWASGEKVVLYLREDTNGIYQFNEKRNAEYLLMPKVFKPNYQWYTFDSLGIYKFLDSTSTYSSPYCTYKNLITVELFLIEKNIKYIYYYKRGIGYIGAKKNDVPISFIEISNKLTNEKPIIAYGCESINSIDSIRNCTAEKIQEYIKLNYKTPADKKSLKTHGKIIISFTVNKEGKVSKVVIKKSIKNAEIIEEELIKVFYGFPKFHPAQVDDGKYISESYDIPVNI
jgi:hypothetical protein